MVNDLYIISQKRILYFGNKKRIWDYNFKNSDDREECLSHLKRYKARISMAR